jgi:hypothetical protein
MNDDGVNAAIRQAIGGDAASIAAILAGADTVEEAVTITMAALLQGDPGRLDRAESVAMTSRDRQVVAIARAHLAGESELVNALARDHLVSFPDSLIVSWIASK